MSEDHDLEHCFEHLSCDDTHHLQYFKQKYLELQKREQNLDLSLLELQKREQHLEQKHIALQKLAQHQHQHQHQQQQQTPFHIVLIDLKLATEKQIIRCVEKPLMGDEDLKYVALSYRWGELSESMVDTGLGYLATVTSFHLSDFYTLCEAISKETDLRFMEYVWVDAICVDQSNHERRKTTIHQMSNIYNRANYILAVPDLHAPHVSRSHLSNRENLRYIRRHGELIFQLLHGNMDQLCRIDNEKRFGDDSPMTSFEQKDKLEKSIDFLLDLVRDWATRVWVISEYNIAKKNNNMKYWFCQLGFLHSSPNQRPDPESFFFLENYLFFKLDFNNLSVSPFKKTVIISAETPPPPPPPPSIRELEHHFELLYKTFHSVVIQNLGTQTFVEMILKSKASKNEDRFHAVLSNSKYKHIISSKDDVDSWKITNFISIKLKLFEFMDTEDKLTLLFLSGSSSSLFGAPDILPTFAISNIHWSARLCRYLPRISECNFALNSKSTIMMTRINDNYKLNIKPIQYFKGFGESSETEMSRFRQRKKLQCKRLELDDPNEPLQIVYIPFPNFKTSSDFVNEYYMKDMKDTKYKATYLLLVGNFHRNRWVLHRTRKGSLDTKDITLGDSFGNEPGFDIIESNCLAIISSYKQLHTFFF